MYRFKALRSWYSVGSTGDPIWNSLFLVVKAVWLKKLEGLLLDVTSPWPPNQEKASTLLPETKKAEWRFDSHSAHIWFGGQGTLIFASSGYFFKGNFQKRSRIYPISPDPPSTGTITTYTYSLHTTVFTKVWKAFCCISHPLSIEQMRVNSHTSHIQKTKILSRSACFPCFKDSLFQSGHSFTSYQNCMSG